MVNGQGGGDSGRKNGQEGGDEEGGGRPDGTPVARGRPQLVVMGVSGSGKSTVGAGLAERLRLPFAEADSFHPAANVAKMAAGTPLDDDDRRPWLDALAGWLRDHADEGCVMSCSALRRRYRDRLRRGEPRLFFLHLDGSEELIAGRLAQRRGHFMPRALLRSQFETLEPLEADEAGVTIPVGGTPEQVSERCLSALGVV